MCDQDRINWNLGKREKPNVTFGPGIWFGWVGMIVLLAGGIALGKFFYRKSTSIQPEVSQNRPEVILNFSSFIKAYSKTPLFIANS